MNHIALIIPIVFTLAACSPSPTMPMQLLQAHDRVSIERIGVIEDDLAYSKRRGIYIITDKKTGKEFIGVSGIGISETSKHLAGKTPVSDER